MKRYIYIGTYTQDILFGTGEVFRGKGAGIYRLVQDTQTGQLFPDAVWSGIENPSFLTLNRQGNRLYCVNELKSFHGAYGGGVSAYEILGKSLRPMGSLATGGADPCFLSLSHDERSLYVANYMSGSVSSFSLNSDGGLDRQTQLLAHAGSGPNPARQTSPHAHSVVFRRDLAYVPDLGVDRLVCYHAETNGLLRRREALDYQAVPGSGPRHCVFSPQGGYCYVANELDNTVDVLALQADGTMERIQRCPALPRDAGVGSSCAGIRLNSRGTYLYVSNRGHDSIASFRCTPDGTLTCLGWTKTMGKIPRDFTITPDDRFLICANQSSDSLTVFALEEDGGLTPLLQYAIPSPVCVVAV